METSDAGPPNEIGGEDGGVDAENPAGEQLDGAGGALQPGGDPHALNFDVPLPETIKIDRISRMSEMKSIWRSGIKQIEDIFADHIARINDLFDDRAAEFDRIRDQLLTNHDFLKRF
jgi:hypothetical protein